MHTFIGWNVNLKFFKRNKCFIGEKGAFFYTNLHIFGEIWQNFAYFCLILLNFALKPPKHHRTPHPKKKTVRKHLKLAPRWYQGDPKKGPKVPDITMKIFFFDFFHFWRTHHTTHPPHHPQRWKKLIVHNKKSIKKQYLNDVGTHSTPIKKTILGCYFVVPSRRATVRRRLWAEVVLHKQ